MKILLSVASLFLTCGVLEAQQTVIEPSTEKSFPASVSVSSGGADISLSITGVAVRKKFFFKVYGMAHYMEAPPSGKRDAVLGEILKDGKAKQIIMEFAREVGTAQVQDAYRDGFRANAAKGEWEHLQPLVEQFVGTVTTGTKDGDRYILTWLPGGIVHARFGAQDAKPITDPVFARVLWSIWLGEDPIVDREELVGRIVTP
jgi:hypothetical protein